MQLRALKASVKGREMGRGLNVLRPMSPSPQLNLSVELQGGRPSVEENERAIRTVFLMIAAFFVCWLPYTALSVVVVVAPDVRIPPLVATMPMYFAKTSPIYNPLIYFLSNKQVTLSKGGRGRGRRGGRVSADVC